MNPIKFLLQTILNIIRQVITLLKSGNTTEAISKLEKLEKDLDGE